MFLHRNVYASIMHRNEYACVHDCSSLITEKDHLKSCVHNYLKGRNTVVFFLCVCVCVFVCFLGVGGGGGWGETTSRKHIRAKVTVDFHRTYSKNGGNLVSESK